jgi:hypothetical protein
MLFDPDVLLGNRSCVALPPASMQSTVVPWQSTPLLFLTDHVPLLIGRFLFSVVSILHQ